MYKADILSFAKKDVKEAAKWYNTKQKGLGKRFTLHVRQKINFIKQDPYVVAIRYAKVRTAVLDVFPFMVHYVIDEANKLIIVSAILHTSRSPDIWNADRVDSDINV